MFFSQPIIRIYSSLFLNLFPTFRAKFRFRFTNISTFFTWFSCPSSFFLFFYSDLLLLFFVLSNNFGKKYSLYKLLYHIFHIFLILFEVIFSFHYPLFALTAFQFFLPVLKNYYLLLLILYMNDKLPSLFLLQSFLLLLVYRLFQFLILFFY